MITKEFREAAREINELFKFIDKKDLDRIPKELQEFFKKVEDKDYIPVIDLDKSLEEQKLNKKTKDILVFLYVTYWCPKEEKEEINKILAKNYNKKQLELREKYNPDDIFKNKGKENIVNKMEMIEYKEPFIKRILNKLKNIFIDKI